VKHYSFEEIYSYLDGEMNPMEKKRLEDHILVCDECASRLEKAREFFSFVKIEDEEPPVEISSLVMEKIDRKRKILPFVYSFLIVLLATLMLPVIIGPSRAMLLYYLEFNTLKKAYSAIGAFFKVSSLLNIPSQVIYIGIALTALPFLFLGLRKLWRKT